MMLQGFVEAIQDQKLLEEISKPVQPLLREAFRRTDDGGARLKNFLSGTWVGHPLHPILKDIPIGGWTMAAIFDALGSSGDPGMRRAADISIATGIVGALASAVTGLSDWSDTVGRPRRIGAAHALINVAATALYCTSLAMRARDRKTAVALAYCGYGTMLLGAYLGGHLVFGEQIGVNHAAQPHLPQDFITVMRGADLQDDRPVKVDAKGLPLVVVRHEGVVYALFERCAHMGGPLSEGKVEDCSIRCPWHASRFSLKDGHVIEGPATMPQPCFEAREIAGEIQVRAREPESP